MLCKICEKIEKEKELRIYEDNEVAAFLEEKPAVPGQILLLTKQHFPILEQLPDKLIGTIFTIANKLSSVLFDSIGCHGTNILINNGIAAGQKHSHFSLNMIPRTENDNIDLEWQPKQLSEEEISTTELKLKEHTASIGIIEQEKEKPIEIEKKSDSIKGKDNYLLKHLRRPA